MSDQQEPTNQGAIQPTPAAQPSFPQTVIVDHGTRPTVATNPDPAQDTAVQDDGRDYEAEIKRLRDEAAGWRTKLRETETQLKEAAPALDELAQLRDKQKTNEEKLSEQLAAYKKAAEEAQAAAELAQKTAKLTLLATKAGIAPDIIGLLDINKLDLEDEAAVLETLKKLRTAPAPAGGGASNPAGQQNAAATYDDNLRSLFGKGQDNRYKIFGG